jgi:hypothetical protein
MTMATFTKTLLKRIEQDLSTRPLADGEFRRITRLGSHYIAKSSTVRDGVSPIFSPVIGGETYNIFKLTSVSD